MATASFDLEDTALARLLHQRGLVPLTALQECLEQVRAGRDAPEALTLAEALVQRGLLSPQQVEATLAGSPPPSSSSSSSDRLAAPTQLGPYRLLRELARGGMGAVHEAVHEPTGVRYAVKTIQPAGLSGSLDDRDRARFAAEAQLMARLDHPNVARIHAAVLDAPVPYLVQDLISGGSLKERLDRAGVFAPDHAVSVTAKLARGLAHAHGLGVLHRDLKPSNVLFDEQGEPRLVDFGLARALDSEGRLTATGDILGTPGYLSPEQALGEKADDPRTDVYGLGAILYALLTGNPPVAPSGSLLMTLGRVVAGEIVPPRQSNPDVPADLNAICLKALATDAAQRYPSAAALATALETRIAPRRRSRRLPILASLVVIAGVGGLVLGGAWTPGKTTERVEPARRTVEPAHQPDPTTSAAPGPPPEVTPTKVSVTWRSAALAVRETLDDPEEVQPFTAALQRHKKIEGRLPQVEADDPAPDPVLARDLLERIRAEAEAIRRLVADRFRNYAAQKKPFPFEGLTRSQAFGLRHGLFLWVRFSNHERLPGDVADLLVSLAAFDPYIRPFDLSLLDGISRVIDPSDADRHRRLGNLAERSSRPSAAALQGFLLRSANAVRPSGQGEARRWNLLRLALRGLRGEKLNSKVATNISARGRPQARAEALTVLAFKSLAEKDRHTARAQLVRAQRMNSAPRTPLMWILWGHLHSRLGDRAGAMRAANTYLAFAQKQRSEGVSAERWVSVVPALSLHWSLAAPSDSAAVSGQLFAWRRHLPSKWRLRFAWLCAYRNELETACSLVETSLSSERWDKTTLNQFAKASGDPKRYGDLFRASLGRIDTLERIQERLKQGERKSAFVLLTRLAEIRKPKQGWLKPKEGR